MKVLKWFGKSLVKLTSLTVTAGFLFYVMVVSPQIHSNLLFAKSYHKIGVVTTLEQQGHGTGFFVQGKSGKPYIMTNVHVCKMLKDQGGLFVNESLKTFVMPVYNDKIADICLLKFPPNIVVPEPFELGSEPLLNEELWTMGYPLDHLKHFSRGAMNGDRLVDIGEEWTPECEHTETINTFFGPLNICVTRRFASETSVQIYPGNSGSPVLNVYGNLVGIVFAGNNESHLGLMARFADVKRVLETH